MRARSGFRMLAVFAVVCGLCGERPAQAQLALRPNSATSLGPFNSTGNVTVNTNNTPNWPGVGNGVVSASGLAAFTFDSGFALNFGHTITVVGVRPIAILVQGDATINGSIIADGYPGTISLDPDGGNGGPGPGGGGGGGGGAGDGLFGGSGGFGGAGNPYGQAGSSTLGYGGRGGAAGTNGHGTGGIDGAGGGGGAYGGGGGAGGEDTSPTSVPGPGGLAYGAGTPANNIIGVGAVFPRGSGGGGGGISLFTGAGGGGGGGGIEIVAHGNLVLMSGALLSVNGGAGGGQSQCGGGGAGGAILVAAMTIDDYVGATLRANGGNGGDGQYSGFPSGGGGGGGRIALYTDAFIGSRVGTYTANGGASPATGGARAGIAGATTSGIPYVGAYPFPNDAETWPFYD